MRKRKIREFQETNPFIPAPSHSLKIASRIHRLTAWNQLEARDGRYIIKGRMLLFPAKIVFALRRILFPDIS